MEKPLAITEIFITKNLKTFFCGNIIAGKDKFGNDRFVADNTTDELKFPFYTFGAAKFWLEICAMVRGKEKTK